MKSKVPSPLDYDHLIESQDPYAIIEYVRERYHGTSFDALDVATVRTRVEQDYVATVRRISGLSTLGLRKIIKSMMEKVELTTLSHILEGIALDVNASVLRSNVTAHGKLTDDAIDELVKTRPLHRAVESLQDKELRDSMLLGLSTFGSNRQGLAIDVSVNNLYARRVWRAMKSSSATVGSAGLRNLFGQWFDLHNIMMIARSTSLGVDPETVKLFLMPVTYRVDRDALDNLVHMGSHERFMESFSKTRYGPAVARYISDHSSQANVASFETGIDRYFAHECAELFSGWRFNSTLPVGFIFLKQYEVHDIGTIFAGKIKGLSAEVIRAELILNQPPVRM